MADYCIYLRKSRKDAEAEARGEGETLTRHQNILSEIAEKYHLNIVKIYKEIISGDSISARPQMKAMLSDIAENKYEGVLVMEIERLARGDTIDQGIVAQTFRNSGTKIITPVKIYDPDNEFDEEYFEFSLFMSRREYKTIRRRMQSGRLSAVKEGNYISTTAPYGYRKISPEPKIHTLEAVPQEAEIIRLIFEMYLDGHGTKFIANELNRMGVKPQKSQYWENSSIKKILGNPIYCGFVGWKTKSNGDTLYKGMHEPIISEDIFNAVQSKRKNNPAVQLRTDNSLMNYYHNVIYCKNCGHQMKRRVITKSGYEHLYCTYSQCRGVTVSAPFSEIDSLILSAIAYRMSLLNGRLSVQYAEKTQKITDKRKIIECELEKVKKQKSKLYDFLEQEIYDKNTFFERSAMLTEKIKSLENALAETEKSTEKFPPDRTTISLQYILDNFSSFTPENKNTLLMSVIRKVLYSRTQRNSAVCLFIGFR